MERIKVRKGRPADSPGFLELVDALAKFEHLAPPDGNAKKRMVSDVFRTRRLNLFVAVSGKRCVGYALYFYAYSSFLARPTFYLEDIFVREDSRGMGTGLSLFLRCADEAVKQECGRMEWAVLTWNENAIKFYERLGAERSKDWYVYRLTSEKLSRLVQNPPDRKEWGS